MAEQLLDKVRDVAEGQIDFEGQKLAELLANVALTLVGIIAFAVGYLLQDIKLAVYIALGGTALTFLIVTPPWSFFNRNPVKWLPVGGPPQPPANIVVNEKSLR
ncbi:microsomal signal peptidase 12 kDa subunit-domain-containing protein [Apodospora peruviana]|uniref:Signal peptidase complex subunit 1 n=1 Tax=Apodospora peruviana TaxID=516989 RepID=A0AAE0ICA2_9PEZI|nr:microsomal signal peptidase 12 kDa subunit-domain-containing protein [Apodospora peruviana]